MKSLLKITLLVAPFYIFSQQYDFPENYKLDTKEDYIKYREDIVKSTDWLVAAPANRHYEKRKRINAFILEWVSGESDLSVNINSDVAEITGDDDLYMIFIGGWAKHVIENDEIENEELEGNIAGIKSIITYYSKNKSILGKNKAIEKYVKLYDKGKLENYIISKF